MPVLWGESSRRLISRVFEWAAQTLRLGGCESADRRIQFIGPLLELKGKRGSR